MTTDEPSPNPLYDDVMAVSPQERFLASQAAGQEPGWLAQEAYERLLRKALGHAADRFVAVQDAQVKPQSVEVPVDTDKADMAVLDLQLELVESGHARVKVDREGHVGLEVSKRLPPALHNRAVTVALNQRIAAQGYAPRRRP